MSFYERTELLVSSEALANLKKTSVLIAGVGGVGSFVAESLARAGVGHLTLIDHDQVAPSNINRQLIALHSTISQNKAILMEQRIKDINPDCKVLGLNLFLSKESVRDILSSGEYAPYDYVVDAIDSLNCKLALLATAHQKGMKIYSSMGAAGKMAPELIRTGDLYDTSVCTLARHVRKKLRPMGVERGIQVVYSLETPAPHGEKREVSHGRARVVNGTISYMPAIFGLTLSSLIIRDIIGKKKI